MPRTDPRRGIKICSTCGLEKLPSDFPNHKLKPDGLSYRCKKCISVHRVEGARRYRESHRAQIREQAKEYQRRVSTDPIKKEKQRAAVKAYYYRNRERLNKNRMYYAKHNPVGRAIHLRGQKKRNGVVLNFKPISRYGLVKLYKDSGDRCFYCDSKLGGEFEYDHFIPLCRGGEHSLENLKISCKSCNRSKHSKMPDEFLKNKYGTYLLPEVSHCHSFA